MAWTAPRTWVTGELVTASHLNTHVRDNLNALNLAPAQTAIVATAQTTTSTSYTDLATSGPAVTITTGATAWVTVSAQLDHNSIRHYMSVAVSGATTITAASNEGAGARMLVINADTYADVTHSMSFPVVGLTPGSNTFTAKYRVDSGTGTFGIRTLTVGRATVVA